MARADLLCELIKAGLRKDDMTFRRAKGKPRTDNLYVEKSEYAYYK